MYVKAYNNEEMSSYVKKVHFKLHESYNNPNRIVTKPPYELTETGWGEFEIVIKIYFHDPNERPVSKQACRKKDCYFINCKENELILGNGISHIEIVSINAWDTIREEKSSVRVLRGDSFSGSNSVNATSIEFQ